ncbi:MAG TPA: hypothetical protein VKA26_00230 [Ignavibacteriaceae bacterium]|nr:hypothetical protein [Ignavibacteriaceae bacterium]
MSLKDKYQPVLELMEELDSRNQKIWVDRGSLFIRAETRDERSKNLIMNKVKQVNNEKGWDIDIKLKVN